MEADLGERWIKAEAMKNTFTHQSERSDWNQKCLASIAREKAEIEKRYNIKIGQTEIRCASCGKPWGFGKHACQDIRLKKLNEVKKGLLAAKKPLKWDVSLFPTVFQRKALVAPCRSPWRVF